MLCGSGRYSDPFVSAGSKILWLGALLAVKWHIAQASLASSETYRIRKNLNFQPNWMYNIGLEADLSRRRTIQAIRFYPLSVYIFGHLIER